MHTTNDPKRLLVLGASGMLGNAVFRFFASSPGFDVVGTVRSDTSPLPNIGEARVISGIDVLSDSALNGLFEAVRPHVVINCVGIIKQRQAALDPLVILPINTLLPHRLAHLSSECGARLVHISTDCVFSGAKGNYTENDLCDAPDLYGRSKALGEIDYGSSITLRTSLVGPESSEGLGLLAWFLRQEGVVTGYTNAIFSGLPTVELARVVRDFVLPHEELCGIFHVSVEPISKYDFLLAVADAYGKKITIEQDHSVRVDRSLDSARFRAATGYVPLPWSELVARMHNFA